MGWAKREGKLVLLAETCVYFLHPTCAVAVISAVHSAPSLLSTLRLEPAALVMARLFLSALRNFRMQDVFFLVPTKTQGATG